MSRWAATLGGPFGRRMLAGVLLLSLLPLAISNGLAPILWSSGTGADVMKRIASPMVGGMVTATILTLVVIPAIYLIWRRWQVARRPELAVEGEVILRT